MNLIQKLQSITFVCLDDDKDERLAWEERGFERQKEAISRCIGCKGYVSLKTRELQKLHEQTQSYDDFHACFHYMMVDNLISYVALGVTVNLELLIEETLRCAENKNSDIISELYRMSKKDVA